ncbi:MAG: hypothetical protein AAB073_02775, partial [Pseudomonadota bacterium]
YYQQVIDKQLKPFNKLPDNRQISPCHHCICLLPVGTGGDSNLYGFMLVDRSSSQIFVCGNFGGGVHLQIN